MKGTAHRETVDDWNAKHPIGTRVRVLRDNGTILDTVTRSAALTRGGHSPAIFVEGIAGCYALSHVNPNDK